MSEIENLKLLLAEIEVLRAGFIGIVRADHRGGERFNQLDIYLLNQWHSIQDAITEAEDDEAMQ